MADAEDVELARSNEADLSGCDFRGADLQDLDFRGRNLSGTQFGKANCSRANFVGADLKEADISFLTAPEADFSSVDLSQRAVGYCDFSNAKFLGATFARSHLSELKFDGSDIRGANFTNAKILDGTTFTGCTIDAATLFDGATAMRSVSRDPTFREYDFVRGKLVRKQESARSELNNEETPIDIGVISSEAEPAPADETQDAPPPPVNAETARSNVSLPVRNVTLLIDTLNQIEAELDKLEIGNSEKSQLRAYINAARWLADAPDPQADLIWEIIDRADKLCSITGLFVAILALFV